MQDFAESTLNLYQGISVSHLRVREEMHTDVTLRAMRWLIITPRAKYCVSGPLALWHIDDNHKLIRYVRLHRISNIAEGES